MTTTNSAASSLLTVKLLGIPSAVNTPVTTASADEVITVLTRRMASGDEEAFRRFHSLYFERLYLFLLAVAHGSEQEARDALQETFIRVARSARGFVSEEIFWCWLKTVARNAARDAGRKQHRYFSFLQRFASEPPPQPEHRDIDAALAECLGQLESCDRDLIEAKYVQGETIREISEKAGLTDRAVESRLMRIRRQLRELLLHNLREP